MESPESGEESVSVEAPDALDTGEVVYTPDTVDTNAVESSTQSAGSDRSTSVEQITSHRDEEADVPTPNLVRPYALTAGRTKSEIYLPLEAPIHTTSPVLPNIWPASDMRAKIVTLCMHGPSVAEISARLNLPLGVARVLVGDLVGSGTLRVSATLDDDATAAERRELIGRTLRGLRAL